MFPVHRFLDDEGWDDVEHLRILDDVRQLKCMATFFLHPEAPVKSSGLESARCYFDRYSFPSEAEVDENERAMILADAAALKQTAGHFLHPEKGVVTTDPFACGRNFFTRFTTPRQEDSEEERNSIIADAIKLKQIAVQFLHPEISMTSSIACTRNYSTRPSGPGYDGDDAIRDEILQDVADLRKSAADYLHPEIPITTTDATCYGRNYFMRHSAPAQESLDEVAECDAIYRDCKFLRQAAVQYLHPELLVACTDPTVFGRNYYMRVSAPTQESFEDFKVCQQVLEDANAFHQLAVEYLHPELPLIIYATTMGRNYFTRGSSPEFESLGDVQARTEVMEELKAFKELARDFLHPELPVIVYATSTGRNYFSRPDAQQSENLEDMEERDRIMTDIKALKQSAVHFLHPELSVVTSDGTACGRNYFSRFSAVEYDDVPGERELVLEDAKALRQAALDFMHPEIPIRTSTACARNYFSRASACHYEDLQDVAEREQCLAEACTLKKLAVDFMHPEIPVVTTDGTAYGRNFFNRFAATEFLTTDECDERIHILADAAALKKLAIDFQHPELPVKSNDSCTRNFFDRPSSKLHDIMIHTFPAHYDDDDYSDQHHNEHIDHFGLMDEEMELYHDLRAELESYPMMDNSTNRSITKYGTNINKADSEVESNLSRSPSSVFLFGLDDTAYE